MRGIQVSDSEFWIPKQEARTVFAEHTNQYEPFFGVVTLIALLTKRC